MTESVKLTRDAEIACLVLNRPHAFNAIDRDLVETLAAQLITLAVDPVRAVVISGEGKAFCAGGDLKYFLSDPQGPGRAIHQTARYFHQAIIEIRRMEKPVIAVINGVAAGGGFSLALASNLNTTREQDVKFNPAKPHPLGK
jgi:2-(1,2-epoxy-1,2-dihydrophenyl)acetyl-CoA isomerase